MTTAIQIKDGQHVMEDLLKHREELMRLPAVGEIVAGHVIEKSHHAIYLDPGIWGLGVIYGRELREDPDILHATNLGDTIQATVVRYDNEEDCTELSLRTATRERNWTELRRKLDGSEIIETEIQDANRGGLIIRVNGVTGFLPVSQLAPDHYPRVEGGDPAKIYERLRQYIKQKFSVKIITADQETDKLIVSEKAAVGDEISAILNQLTPGKVINGTVSGVVDFGVFVKFEEGGKDLEGLVHISELAWQRIDNPLDFVRPGERVQARVIEVDGLRISLSMKQLKEDPWSHVRGRYHVGDTVPGEILKVTPFGAFVKLDADIHGLVHVSELPEGVQHDPASVLKAGEKRNFTIISLEPAEHRLGLSLRPPGAKKGGAVSALSAPVEQKTESLNELTATGSPPSTPTTHKISKRKRKPSSASDKG